MSSYISLEKIDVFSLQGSLGTWKTINHSFLFIMNCLTLAYTLKRAVFVIGYNPKAFQTSVAVQAPAESPHFSDSGAGFEEQGVVGLNTNEGSCIFPVFLATTVLHKQSLHQAKKP